MTPSARTRTEWMKEASQGRLVNDGIWTLTKACRTKRGRASLTGRKIKATTPFVSTTRVQRTAATATEGRVTRQRPAASGAQDIAAGGLERGLAASARRWRPSWIETQSNRARGSVMLHRCWITLHPESRSALCFEYPGAVTVTFSQVVEVEGMQILRLWRWE